MRLKHLHDYVKQNYENGQFAQNYSYEAKQSNQASDFSRGQQQARQDFQNGARFKFYPLLLVKIVDFLTLKRLTEVKNFIEGYNCEKRKLAPKSQFGQKWGRLPMKANNRSSVIAICSSLNALFLIGLVIFDQYWDTVPGWVFYPYVFLMVINAGILIVAAMKRND